MSLSSLTKRIREPVCSSWHPASAQMCARIQETRRLPPSMAKLAPCAGLQTCLAPSRLTSLRLGLLLCLTLFPPAPPTDLNSSCSLNPRALEQFLTLQAFHRMVWLEGILKPTQFQPPATGGEVPSFLPTG